MKKCSLLGSALVISAVAFSLGVGQQVAAKGGPPNSDNCTQFSGTYLSPTDLDGIIKVLQKNAKHAQNYKVRVWNNGNPTGTIGQMQINQAVMADSDQYAKLAGLTAITIQVGICNVRVRGGDTSNALKFKKLRKTDETDQLFDEINAILKKYNH